MVDTGSIGGSAGQVQAGCHEAFRLVYQLFRSRRVVLMAIKRQIRRVEGFIDRNPPHFFAASPFFLWLPLFPHLYETARHPVLHPPVRSPLELVVARYTEELNWLLNAPKSIRITVYDKSGGSVLEAGAVPLPNIGREAHTYLHHVVGRYDSLNEWTIFCQGKPFDHAYDFHHRLREMAADQRTIGDFRWLGHIIDTDDERGERLFTTWSKNDDGRGLDLAGFHRTLFGTDGPELYPFVLGAQFVVHRDVIRQRPVSFYEHALAVSITFPDAAHCYERTWNRVFGQVGVDPVWLDGRLTVYLKPIKRQG